MESGIISDQDEPGLEDSSHLDDPVDKCAYGEAITSLAFREVESGRARTIVAIVDPDGSCKADNYLTSLSEADQAQFKARFERYTQIGFLRSPEEMRIIEEKNVTIRVHEIKTRNGHRLFGVQEDVRFVLSHGAKKPKTKEVKKHAKRARAAYSEWISRGGDK